MKNIAMKRMLGIFVLSLLLTSCKSELKVEQDSYVINGTAPGVVHGVRAYSKTVDSQRRELIQDSAIIIKEKFTFKGEIAAPTITFNHQ